MGVLQFYPIFPAVNPVAIHVKEDVPETPILHHAANDRHAKRKGVLYVLAGTESPIHDRCVETLSLRIDIISVKMRFPETLPPHVRWNTGNPLSSVTARAIRISFLTFSSFPLRGEPSMLFPSKYVSVTSMMTAQRRVRRIRWLAKRLDVWNIDMKGIYVYVEARQKAGIKKKTLRIEMMNLEHRYSFLGLKTMLPRFKREPSPDPYVPTPADIHRIMSYCDSHHNREIWLRNKVMIGVFCFTGVRIGELERINLEDVRDGMLYVRSEKGEKDRHVPLPERLHREMQQYVTHFRMPSDPRAPFTSDSGRMKYQYIRNVVRRIGSKLDLPELHPHSFRHFYGTHMYRITNDLRLVQILLGHARIETTTIYEHLSTREAAGKGKSAVEELFRGSEKMSMESQIPAGAVQNKWEYWEPFPGSSPRFPTEVSRTQLPFVTKDLRVRA